MRKRPFEFMTEDEFDTFTRLKNPTDYTSFKPTEETQAMKKLHIPVNAIPTLKALKLRAQMEANVLTRVLSDDESAEFEPIMDDEG